MTRLVTSLFFVLVLSVLKGCHSPLSVGPHFHTDNLKPLSLKASSLTWQWDEEAVSPSPWPYPQTYLEEALKVAFVPEVPEEGALGVSVQAARWREIPEHSQGKESGLFAGEPGTIGRVEYDVSVGELDSHGFQKRSINVQVYDQVLIPRYTSLAERRQKMHELCQRACERLVALLQERLTQRFSDLVIDATS